MPLSSISKPSETRLQIALAVLVTSVFSADIYVDLGIAVWVLYCIPLCLSAYSTRPSTPIVSCLACVSLLLAAFLTSPPAGAEATFSPLNRAFGFVTFWVIAIGARAFCIERAATARQAWINQTHTGLLSHALEGEHSLVVLGNNILGYLARSLDAQVGAIYLENLDGSYSRFATHSMDAAYAAAGVVQRGEGLVGQVAQDNRLLHVKNVPPGYLDVRSGVGAHAPSELLLAPAYVDGRVRAVMEFGFFGSIDEGAFELLTRVSQSIATAVRSVNYRSRQQTLLEETQRQGEELQTQQEELRVQNEALERQTFSLRNSQAELENQQAELEQINNHLAERTDSLTAQRNELAQAHAALQRASAYKSEFLANMSHELRTPLNSTLILAKLLADNPGDNLNEQQVTFAQTIYSAGNDLLVLINDILDLSRIEAGELTVHPEPAPLSTLMMDLANTFQPMADSKGLQFSIVVPESLPETILTDSTRLLQILRNLLSNALKFTAYGSVTLNVTVAPDGAWTFSVSDTGIGILLDHQEGIFEAFRQADGTTNRKYGGTGLGLSISRDLARLLGGNLSVVSVPGQGSTFSLMLPERPPAALSHGTPQPIRHAGSGPVTGPMAVLSGRAFGAAPSLRAAPRPEAEAPISPRRALSNARSARSLLIVEDDIDFARVIQDIARELEFETWTAYTADQGLALAESRKPSAIILDVGLPDHSGLSVLDTLKHRPSTRHIPVHVISGSDYTHAALGMGAVGYAIKPVARDQLVSALKHLESKFTQRMRRVLVVEDDDALRDSTCRLLAGDNVEVIAEGTAAGALARLGSLTFDCVVMDLKLPDGSGFDLLSEMSRNESYAFPPVIVYTGRALSAAEQQQLERYSSSIVVKGARSPERLFDEVSLFLHQVEAELPAMQRRLLRDARHREDVFEERRILVVEDDVRNIFALTSVLEPKGTRVEIARNGREALDHLQANPGVDLVLMDIMMPEMDGLEATRRIRSDLQLLKLPIIALTAKAMKDDRESCISAGANDYIAKPFDVDRLLSLIRVWMPK